MVSAAVNAASARVRPGRTTEINAIVERKVSEATASQRKTAYVLGAILVVALCGLGGLIYWSTRSQDDIQRLREELAQAPIASTEQHSIFLTISVGLAEVTPGINSVEAFLSKADSALYAAKRNGRNRVCIG